MTAVNYGCVISACLLQRDLISSLETLQDCIANFSRDYTIRDDSDIRKDLAVAKKLQLQSLKKNVKAGIIYDVNAVFGPQLQESIQKLLVRILKTVDNLDVLYYALLDVCTGRNQPRGRPNESVPAMASTPKPATEIFEEDKRKKTAAEKEREEREELQKEVAIASPRHIVPRIALDAIIEAAGRFNIQFLFNANAVIFMKSKLFVCYKRQDLTDRAFATFAEYPTLFKVEPDVHSYNALLTASAASRVPNVHTLLSIFQDMEVRNNFYVTTKFRSIKLFLYFHRLGQKYSTSEAEEGATGAGCERGPDPGFRAEVG